MKVLYTTLFVDDPERAHAFYTRILGLSARLDVALPNGGRFRTVGAVSGVEIVLWPGTPGGPRASADLAPGALILETTDCRADVARLTAAGVSFETEVIERPDARVAVVRDPAGNRIALREPRR